MINPYQNDIDAYKDKFDTLISHAADDLETKNPAAFESFERVLDTIDPDREDSRLDGTIALYLRDTTEPVAITNTESGIEVEFTKTKFDISDLSKDSTCVSLKIEISTDGEPHLMSIERTFAHGEDGKVVTRTVTETFSPDGYVVDRLDVTMSGETDKIAETHWETSPDSSETIITMEHFFDSTNDFGDDIRSFSREVTTFTDASETHLSETYVDRIPTSDTDTQDHSVVSTIEFTEDGRIEKETKTETTDEYGEKETHTRETTTYFDEDGRVYHTTSHDEISYEYTEKKIVQDHEVTVTYSDNDTRHEVWSTTKQEIEPSQTLSSVYEKDVIIKSDLRMNEWRGVDSAYSLREKPFCIEGKITEIEHFSNAEKITEIVYSNDGEKVTEERFVNGIYTDTTVYDMDTGRPLERTVFSYDRDSETYHCKTCVFDGKEKHISEYEMDKDGKLIEKDTDKQPDGIEDKTDKVEDKTSDSEPLDPQDKEPTPDGILDVDAEQDEDNSSSDY